ncbi:MAG: hypothetical protein R2695_16900 [Acidimicrobiales bacterium]
MAEAAVDQIDDGFATSQLPGRWKAAVAWADVVIGAATSPEIDPRTELSLAEIAELTLTVAVAQGFSKAAIAWGPAPVLPTMTVPTPGTPAPDPAEMDRANLATARDGCQHDAMAHRPHPLRALLEVRAARSWKRSPPPRR